MTNKVLKRRKTVSYKEKQVIINAEIRHFQLRQYWIIVFFKESKQRIHTPLLEGTYVCFLVFIKHAHLVCICIEVFSDELPCSLEISRWLSSHIVLKAWEIIALFREFSRLDSHNVFKDSLILRDNFILNFVQELLSELGCSLWSRYPNQFA